MAEAFLRNAWYVAGWPEHVTRSPLRRTLLNEPIVLFRREDGTPVALADRCPHRFVPLSLGRLIGDELQCAYHGLRFDRDGKCTLNPHGDGRIPPGARVRSYPLRERDGVLWIWMGGDAERAAATEPPEIAVLHDPTFRLVSGSMVVGANYQLITDNLLDLSHVQFLHPLLRVPNAGVRVRHEVRQDGDSIWSMLWRDNALPNGLQQLFWPRDKIGDGWAHMRWSAPSILFLDVGITELGGKPEDGVSIPSVHLLTPETDNTTHYFWGFLRDRRTDDEGVSEQIRKLGLQAFEQEDKPIIEAQQRNMSSNDIMSLGPALLQPDGAAVQVRRALKRLIESEFAGSQ